ncbi:MAG: hypothetical protein EOO12_01550 [Chitinophagaceae bacterium]|nr:MAG: hypothetical protein EOO12_01550 [Chitinophagaceae bacterium]
MVHPDPRSSVALQLKEDTRAVHEALEARLLPILENLTHGKAYARLLRAFYGFYQPLETRIAEQLSLARLPDLGGRRKASWLLEDLAALGEPAPGLADIPGQLPPIDGEAAAWGALYVLEGSTLGGRIICRMLEKQLPGAPLRFFAGYGTQTGPYWTAFLAAFAQASARLPYSDIRQSAFLTFQSFDLWLQQHLPAPAPTA